MEVLRKATRWIYCGSAMNLRGNKPRNSVYGFEDREIQNSHFLQIGRDGWFNEFPRSRGNVAWFDGWVVARDRQRNLRFPNVQACNWWWKNEMADFMIPSTVKLKLLFKIIDSFFFVFFFHKKIEIEINWDCTVIINFLWNELSEIIFD